MDEQIQKLLKDILNSISNIELFSFSRPKEYQVFCEDRCFRSAVQWEIAIIGEAMNRILKINPNIPITSARRIVDTRNYLIHGYDSLREDIIWAIVVRHLPLLKQEVLHLCESSK
jgi:uncharacterized protein with HEPN domain